MKLRTLLIVPGLALAGVAQAQSFALESAVLDSRTARNLGVSTERGELATLLRAQKAMTFGILRASGIPLESLAPEVRSRIERLQTTNLEAFRAFASGLDLKDQGRFAEAKEAFRRAAELDPGFALAQEQQQAMPDVNVLNPVQLRAVIAATATAAVDRGKASFAVDLARATAALQAGQTVVATAATPADSAADSTRRPFSVVETGDAAQFAPNLSVGLAYTYTASTNVPIGVAFPLEVTRSQYEFTPAGVLESVNVVSAQGQPFYALRGGATASGLASATLADGGRVYWGSWLSTPAASARVTVNGVPVQAPVLGQVDFMFGEATRTMPGTGSAVYTPTGGSLGNVSGNIGVNFVTRNVTLNSLGFTLGGFTFSGLTGNAVYGDGSGFFQGNYSSGSCAGCPGFVPQASAFGGNFAGRNADGLIFSTFLLTGNGTLSGVQLFQRP